MVDHKIHITEKKVWDLLFEIPDPDIPVINIVELGLVRNIEITDDEKVIVTITPSYSGCPAMPVFKEDIYNKMSEAEIEDVEIKISLLPPWTTDWLSNATKEKMKQHGIAPPEQSSHHDIKLFTNSKNKITCPHCNNNDTQLTSQFGSTPCKALWYCKSCQQPFEYFKCH
ncbi:MAG: 1,2-phenylacetyl-CoA epoxidase subunit PaaD [Bacteroidota bacterium]|nr:1,2-phenylacetyl-CoA epoxidase subunit PaaD [Bacteroidota bacterium]